MNTLEFNSDYGTPILARIVGPGERYGVIHRVDEVRPFVAVDPLIEFYDTRYRHDPVLNAQFITSYDLAQFSVRPPGALWMSGGILPWTLDTRDVAQVQRFVARWVALNGIPVQASFVLDL